MRFCYRRCTSRFSLFSCVHSKYNKLKARLQQLQKVNEDYDRQINMRKKQFHLFLYALKCLQKTIDGESCFI